MWRWGQAICPPFHPIPPRPAVRARSMSYALNEDSPGDRGNARFLAVAADLAYLPAAEGKAKFQQELGLTAQLISHGNTQAYVAGNDDNLVLAFRGTESPTGIEGLKDWLLTNALNLLVVPEGRLGTDLAAAGVGARFHEGFVTAIESVWPDVLKLVEAEQQRLERPIWVTGHSLGGALALLAGWLLTRKMLSVTQIVTFGAPMIGNQLAVDAINREFGSKISRFVTPPDPVPRLPMYSFVANEFVHCDREVPVSQAGAEDPTTAFFHSLAKNAVETLMSATLVDDLWKGIRGGIAAHGMDNYRKLLG